MWAMQAPLSLRHQRPLKGLLEVATLEVPSASHQVVVVILLLWIQEAMHREEAIISWCSMEAMTAEGDAEVTREVEASISSNKLIREVVISSRCYLVGVEDKIVGVIEGDKCKTQIRGWCRIKYNLELGNNIISSSSPLKDSRISKMKEGVEEVYQQVSEGQLNLNSQIMLRKDRMMPQWWRLMLHKMPVKDRNLMLFRGINKSLNHKNGRRLKMLQRARLLLMKLKGSKIIRVKFSQIPGHSVRYLHQYKDLTKLTAKWDKGTWINQWINHCKETPHSVSSHSLRTSAWYLRVNQADNPLPSQPSLRPSSSNIRLAAPPKPLKSSD